MNHIIKRPNSILLIIFVIALSLGACASPTEAPQPTSTQAVVEEVTDTPLPPSPTPTEEIPTDTPIPTTAEPSETPTEAIPTDTATPEPTKEPTRPPIRVEVYTDIQYGQAQNNVLDVYQPQVEGELLPTLIVIHGMGSGKYLMEDLANYYARQGYAVVVYNKSIGRYPTDEADSFCALAWVHASAEEYGFDTTKIVPVGFSRGGALAAFLGTVDEPGKYMQNCPQTLPDEDYLAGVVSVAGYFDYRIWIGGQFILDYFGEPNENMEDILEASPITWVDGSEPPFLLIHGEADPIVDPQQSVEFEAALSEAGSDVTLVMLPAQGHDTITTSVKVLTTIRSYLEALFSE
jgi:acetyl esterase/lipase